MVAGCADTTRRRGQSNRSASLLHGVTATQATKIRGLEALTPLWVLLRLFRCFSSQSMATLPHAPDVTSSSDALLDVQPLNRYSTYACSSMLSEIERKLDTMNLVCIIR